MGIIVDAVVAEDLFDVVSGNVKSSHIVKSVDGSILKFVDAVVGVITSTVDAGQGSISLLRIWSHGWTIYPDGGDFPSGNVEFGHGGDDLRTQTFDKFKDTLGKLTRFFASPGRAELRGCAAARGPNGKLLMEDLAKVWKVEVNASENAQWQILTWSGKVFAAYPDERQTTEIIGKPTKG
jgi:hypothetical protein